MSQNEDEPRDKMKLCDEEVDDIGLEQVVRAELDECRV